MAEDKSHSGLCVNQFNLEITVYFSAQIADIDVYKIRSRIEMRVPDLSGYFGSRQQASGIADEKQQQIVFLRCKRDGLSAPENRFRAEVYPQIGIFNRVR
jgi:hypothetical protein